MAKMGSKIFGGLNQKLRYGHLCGFLEAKLVILGPIDFLFGLPINLIVNVANIAKLRPKIGQIPF